MWRDSRIRLIKSAPECIWLSEDLSCQFSHFFLSILNSFRGWRSAAEAAPDFNLLEVDGKCRSVVDRPDWEFEIDMYTLLYLKQITSKDLLFSTGTPASHVLAWAVAASRDGLSVLGLEASLLALTIKELSVVQKTVCASKSWHLSPSSLRVLGPGKRWALKLKKLRPLNPPPTCICVCGLRKGGALHPQRGAASQLPGRHLWDGRELTVNLKVRKAGLREVTVSGRAQIGVVGLPWALEGCSCPSL